MSRLTVRDLASKPEFMHGRVFIKFPWLVEAQVCGVSDDETFISSTGGGDGGGHVTRWTPEEKRARVAQLEEMKHTHLTKLGLDLSDLSLMVHVRPIDGLVRNIDGTIEKRFRRDDELVPLQCIVRDTSRRGVEDSAAFRHLSSFEVGQRAIFLGRAHFGAVCTVLGPGTPLTKDGSGSSTTKTTSTTSTTSTTTLTYRVQLTSAPTTSAAIAKHAKKVLWNMAPPAVRLNDVAKQVGVNFRMIAILSGSLWVTTGPGRDDRTDLGLGVKAFVQGVPHCAPDFAQQDYQNLDEHGDRKSVV